MKAIFFNIWHGQVWDKLQKFILDQSITTDIFCFLEVDPELQRKLEINLVGFRPIYHKGIKTTYLGGTITGRSIFIKEGIEVGENETVGIYNDTETDSGGLSYVELRIDGKKLLIGSLHGKAQPGNKLDTPVRLEQSRIVIDFFKNKEGLKIIGGDFNLMPETRSIKMFEEAGYKNLIKEFGIKSTRNSLAWEQFRGQEKQYFADYVFVSPGVKVKSFEVPHLEVSDHLPLILDFEV